jgi:chloramphenicol-sensitive protein RarD
VTTSASGATPQGAARGQASGIAIATACFLCWGLVPFYFKALAAVGPFEVVAHRILWSALSLACLLPFGGAWAETLAVFRDRRQLLTLTLTAALIFFTWTLYVAAVQGGQVLDASLGYFLGPLVSVALGVVVQGDRLSRVQAAAVALAALAVLNLAWQLGVVPKVALALGISFSVSACSGSACP